VIVLVFRAVIEAIDCAPVGIRGAFRDWIVRTRIEHVTSGEFTGTHFEFRVHSPSRSGLEVGQTVTVEAKPTPEGFTVDEDQWMRG
jgi:hypothetical protein